MKPWMKILMWFSVGAGIGFFAGQRVGLKQGYRQYEKYVTEENERLENASNELEENLDRYRGNIHTMEGLDELLKKPDTDEEPEMPMEEPVIPEIETSAPQLISKMIPMEVSEEAYYQNLWEAEEERLIFYEIDEVLYNCTTQSVETVPDAVVGKDTLFHFHVGPGQPKDTLFVINEVRGTRYRIDRMDEAFCDAVEGNCAPEDDEPETVAATAKVAADGEDDFWDDV